jgi:branched-chain amino acid aminotransferase
MNWVCIDGELIPSKEAKISVWDHGLLYGDGLFETMRSYDGKVFALEKHLIRLRQGAELLKLKIDYEDAELERLIAETLRANNISNAYIRLTYTRGSGPIGIDPDLCPKGCLIIMAKESNIPESLYREGIELAICPVVRNHGTALPPSIKSLNFLNNILAKLWAKEQGFAEALMLNQDGCISETTVSNIFFVKKGIIFTPSLASGILPGVTREYIIQFAQSKGYAVEQGLYQPEELFAADEIFLTNSGSEVIPVKLLNNKPIGYGTPGKITTRIHDLLRIRIKETLNLR